MWVCVGGRESWGELEPGLGTSVLLLESREGSHCPPVSFSSQWPSYQRHGGRGQACSAPGLLAPPGLWAVEPDSVHLVLGLVGGEVEMGEGRPGADWGGT